MFLSGVMRWFMSCQGGDFAVDSVFDDGGALFCGGVVVVDLEDV